MSEYSGSARLSTLLSSPRVEQHPPSEVEDDPSALWPEHILRWGAVLKTAPPRDRREVLGRVWRILHVVLLRYARGHARHLGRVSIEDLRDVAADKASDLVARLDRGDWDLAASSPALLRSFLGTIARNGVVDALRTGRREVLLGDDLDPRGGRGVEGATQEDAIGGEEFVRELIDCVEGLSVRARRAWFLRVCYEFNSVEIARHPNVASSPAGVDAMLARCREHVRACMEKKGVAMRTLPAGTFVRLWELTERDRSDLGAER